MTTRARFGRAAAGALAAAALLLGALVAMPAPAAADVGVPGALPALPPLLPRLSGNPTIGTDLFAATVSLTTGGTQRDCATSGLGITVRCVENVRFLPAASTTAVGVTFGHWVFCKTACVGSLLVHELVHVAQFEQHGDLFGPMYLLEAGVNGTGCDNQWERPAYQTGGQCLD